MTPQEIFTRIATHLLTQNEHSTDGQEFVIQRVMGRCQYRGVRGLKCAIGCLIEDHAYDVSLEQRGCGEPRVKDALRRSGIVVEDVPELLHDLQMLHDRHPVLSWRTELHRVAIKYGLRFPEEVL